MRCKTGMYCGRANDPFWSDVLLLLHMDGTAGSSTFVDSGPNTVTVNATNATLQTTQVKYGSAAGDFTAQAQLSVPSVPTAVSGDVTIEGWFYATNDLTGFNTLISTGVSEVHRVYVYEGALVLRFNSIQQITHQTAVTANVWHHWAAVRKSGVWRLYLDGVQSNDDWSNSTTLTTSWVIGWDGFSGQDFVGYLDDFRATAAARYDGTFTPPGAAFPEG